MADITNPYSSFMQTTGTQSAQTSWSSNSAGNLTPEMKTYYDMTLIDEASAALVHDQFGQKRPIPANGGKTIEFRKFSALPKATTPITEGVTPSGNQLTVNTIEAQVSQYGDYIVQSDILEMTAIDNTILEATKLLGKQAGTTLDTITRNILVGGTNVMYSSKTVSGELTKVTSRKNLDDTAALTVKDIQFAVAKLRGQNAPTINGKYVAIIHPYVAYQLMRDPEWIDAHKYAEPTNLYEGEIGELAGVRFVQTTEAKILSDSTCPANGTGYHSVYCTLVLGEGAYGTTEISGGGLQTIVKQLGFGDDPLNQRSSVGWKATKTAERLVEQYMIRIESCCPDFDDAKAN